MGLTGGLETLPDVLITSLTALFTKLASFLPSFIAALLIIFVGWLAAKIFKGITKKVVQWTGLERAMEKSRINESLKTIGIKKGIGDVIAVIVFWIVLLVFLVSAAEVLGLSVVLSTLNKLILYVPNIIAALVIIVLALFIARFLKDIIAVSLTQFNLFYARPLARAAEILIIVLGILVALAQLGFDIGLLVANTTIFIGGFVAIVALSMGLGARSIAANLIAGYYIRNLFKEGQDVELCGVKGKITRINNINVVLKTKSGELVVPNNKIIEKGSLKEVYHNKL
jgi:hypothetical protein